MQWGGQENFLQEIEERDGVEPKALLDKPEPNVAIDYYLNAFSILSPSRNVGAALGAIPLSEYAAYMSMMPLLDDAEIFVFVMRGLDEEYMEYYNRKRK